MLSAAVAASLLMVGSLSGFLIGFYQAKKHYQEFADFWYERYLELLAKLPKKELAETRAALEKEG